MSTGGSAPGVRDVTREVRVAAGGVVLRWPDGAADGRPASEVLVVHRPAYDDWSLPKGHVDPGETPSEAALREVAEETGVRALILGDAGTTEHLVPPPTAEDDGEGPARAPAGALKRVHWFVMRPGPGSPDPAARTPDAEVDVATWWPVGQALRDLTHAGERALLLRAVGAA